MEYRGLPVIPAVRVGTQLHLTATYSGPGGRRGSAGPPPALMADVRVVVRRHFPVGPKGVIIEKVADDIAVRRQPSRKLRTPESVERVLAERVLPFVEHPFDRRAVAVASKQICEYVSGACADPRLAHRGVRVLVLVDTFACGTLLLPVPRKQSSDDDDSLRFGTVDLPVLRKQSSDDDESLRFDTVDVPVPRKQSSDDDDDSLRFDNVDVPVPRKQSSDDDSSLQFGIVVRTCPCLKKVRPGREEEPGLATSAGNGSFVRTCPCMEIGMGVNNKPRGLTSP
uniref:Uncharacterized protein n=1 Tax=Oryza brachyantha TaxID=4533 RepID=J3LML6_ORYBR